MVYKLSAFRRLLMTVKVKINRSQQADSVSFDCKGILLGPGFMGASCITPLTKWLLNFKDLDKM